MIHKKPLAMGFPARSFGFIFARSKFWWSCLIARYELLHKSLNDQAQGQEGRVE